MIGVIYASFQCARPVELEQVSDDGSVERTALQPELVLKKEIGNARLVSGDAMLWVGNSSLSFRDSDSDAMRVAEVKNGTRSFVFAIAMDDAGKRFVADLKTQVQGQAGLEVRRKKRKIRKQMTQSMGFVPVNTLKTPTKKPPSTPKRSPLTSIMSPRRTLSPALNLSVASVPDAYQILPSPAKSPYRSPFRKKVTPPKESPPLRTAVPLTNVLPPSPSSARKWLSPAHSSRTRSGSMGGQSSGSGSNSVGTSAKRVRHDSAEHDGSLDDNSRRESITGVINKRVRSLQLMLDDQEPNEKDGPPVVQGKQESRSAKSPMKQSAFFMKKPQSTQSSTRMLSPHRTEFDTPSGAGATSGSVNQAQDESMEPRADTPMQGPAATSTSIPVRSSHGLLNLGNYCYMNAIVQALASLPDFVTSVQNEDELVNLIRKRVSSSQAGAPRTLEQVRADFDSWKTDSDTKRLVLQYALNQLLQQVVDGSENAISPEPLKNIMGRHNAIFATYASLPVGLFYVVKSVTN